MPKTAKKTPKKASQEAVSRESRSGIFTVASTAKPPKRFTVEQIRDAVRKVNEAQRKK